MNDVRCHIRVTINGSVCVNIPRIPLSYLHNDNESICVGIPYISLSYLKRRSRIYLRTYIVYVCIIITNIFVKVFTIITNIFVYIR